LQRRNGMNGGRSAKRGGASLREFVVAHLAARDEFRHRAYRLFDRSIRIDSVLIVKVDVVDTETTQAGVASRTDVLRAAADSTFHGIAAAHDAELGRDDRLVSPIAECPPEEFFVGMWAVHVGGIEKIDAEFEGAMNRCNRFTVF